MASDTVNKLATSGQKAAGWGTILDFKSKVPTKYVGLSFQEAWHDDIDKFNNMSDEEKWQVGYWAEHQAYVRAGRSGFVLGTIIMIIIVFVVVGLS